MSDMYDGIPTGELCERLAVAEARVKELEAQLPEGMRHCTILFKSCSLGHGWLTATNWAQHPCPTCTLKAAEVRLASWRAGTVTKELAAASADGPGSDDPTKPFVSLTDARGTTFALTRSYASGNGSDHGFVANQQPGSCLTVSVRHQRHEWDALRSRLAALAPLEAAARELVLSLEAVDVIGFFRVLVDVVAAARALPEEGK